jgi:serine/threonine-protein kinase
LTRPGSVVGTPYYMSPEQIQGSREIDHRADLWALAAIACECLTGRRPFEAPDFAQLAVMLLGNQGRPLPSQLGPVPPGFDAWFLRATDSDIGRRFQTAREMVQTLAPICDVAPSSLGNDYPPAHALSSTRQDAPSMAAVSNTSSRSSLTRSLWQRPIGTLVGTTIVSTLLVTGGLVFWLARHPAVDPKADANGNRTVGTALALTPASPMAAGPGNGKPSPNPGIRPIIAPTSDGLPGAEPPKPETGQPERTETLGFAPPARHADDGFDRDEAQRQVRAKLLDRPRHTRGKAKRDKGANAVKGTASGAAAMSAPSDGESAPSPRATKPPVATPPSAAVESAPSVVDGRRIRTSL